MDVDGRVRSGTVIEGDGASPPAFAWDRWYGAVGGRTIAVPEVDALLRHIYDDQTPRFHGDPSPAKVDLGPAAAAADRIKEVARGLGADVVGIARVEPSDLYRGRTVPHPFAIMIGKRMRYAEFAVVPSRESAIECVRIYVALGEICIALAGWLREHGHAAQVEHPLGDADVLHIPLALKAGLGELGRHGSIIHPELGPMFRLGGVLTDLDLAPDAPIDVGIAAFCDTCRACRIYCPADAVPDERDPKAGLDHLGNPRYVVDTGRCFPYFARNYYCSACLPVCVYEHKKWARDFEGRPTPKFPRVVMNDPPPPASEHVPREARHHYPRRDLGELVQIRPPNRKSPRE
jgi:ferredoxin